MTKHFIFAAKLSAVVSVSLAACFLFGQFAEYQTCTPAQFIEPAPAAGRDCFWSGSGCFGYGNVSLKPCGGMEQSQIVPGKCDSTASKIECMTYSRTIENYVHKKRTFHCGRVLGPDGALVYPPQCQCTSTPDDTPVALLTITDCLQRNFP